MYEGDANSDSNSIEVIIARLRRKIGHAMIEDQPRPWLSSDERHIMKLVPASLGGLLLGAAVFVAAALAAASILIGFILHRFVTGQIEQRLGIRRSPAIVRSAEGG